MNAPTKSPGSSDHIKRLAQELSELTPDKQKEIIDAAEKIQADKKAIHEKISTTVQAVADLLTENGFNKSHAEIEKFLNDSMVGNPALMEKINTWGLTTRAFNCLKKEDIGKGIYIEYAGDLVLLSANELLKIPNLGKNSLKEIQEILASKGLVLGMKMPDWFDRRPKREA